MFVDVLVYVVKDHGNKQCLAPKGLDFFQNAYIHEQT